MMIFLQLLTMAILFLGILQVSVVAKKTQVYIVHDYDPESVLTPFNKVPNVGHLIEYNKTFYEVTCVVHTQKITTVRVKRTSGE